MPPWARALSRMLIYEVPGESEWCPACHSRHLFDLDLHVLRRPIRGQRIAFITCCRACGLVFRNPTPSREELASFYSPEGDWGARRAAPAAEVAPRDQRARGRSWARMFDPIREAISVTEPPAGARVLDFGCGDGRLLDALQDCGWETWGIETSIDTAFRRHQKLDAIPASATFDLVIAHHVLEHLADPLIVLRQLAGACRMDGHLLVGVPRLDTLPIHRDYKYVLNGHAHVTAYTWSCLRTLLARAAWAPVGLPPAEIAKGGGRRTTSRLRVLARRVEGPVAEPPRPADEARAAIRAYYAQRDSRPLLARAGLLRLAARRAEAGRQRARAARKSAKQAAVSGQRAT